MRQYVIFLNRISAENIYIENVRWTQFKTLATDHVGIRQRNEHRLRCRWNEPRELLNWVSAKTLAQTRKTKEKKNNHTNNESRMFAADRCALCVSRDDVHPNSCIWCWGVLLALHADCYYETRYHSVMQVQSYAKYTCSTFKSWFGIRHCTMCAYMQKL